MALGEKLAGNASASAVKAGEAFFEVNADDSGVISSLKRLGNRIKSFGSFLGNIGVGIGGVGAATLTPLLGLFASAVEGAADLHTLAEQWNTNTEAVSRFQYAAKQTGISFDDMRDAVKTLEQAIHGSLDGNGKMLLAFREMGTSAEEFVKIPIDEKLVMIADGFEKIENPLERSQYLISLFGEKASRFIPLLSKGADGVREMFAEAERNGAITTTEQGRQAKDIQEAWTKTFDSIKRLLFEVGAAFFGLDGDIKETSQTFLLILGHARAWVKENRQIIVTIAGIAAAAVGIGVALVTISSVISALVALKAAGLAVLTVVFSPFILKLALISAAVAGVIYLFGNFKGSGDELKKTFTNTFVSIGESFSVMWKGIVDALKSGNLALAAKIALTGLEIAWKEAQLGIEKAQVDNGATFSKTWTDVVDGMAMVWADFMDTLETSYIGWIGIVKYGIGSLTDELGITTGKADAAAADVKKKLDKLKEERKAIDDILIGDNVKRQAELDKKHADDRKKAEAELQALKDKLKGLAAEAAVPKADDMKPWEKHEQDKAAMMTRLGDSARGTFHSADYRGTLGIGPANDYAKKNNDQLKAIRDELIKLNRKPGQVFG